MKNYWSQTDFTLGTSRHAVMRTFQRVRPLTGDAQIDLAIEYLKIGPAERDILTGAVFAAPSPPTLAKLYGQDGLPPVELEPVATFLERTRLRYAQLTEILRTRFINPNGADHNLSIIIVFSDNRCDTNSRYLRLKKDGESTGEPRSLQAEAWDRLQRFIRLWRKLGWSIADVDRALAALGVTAPDVFDLRFLRRFGQMVQLRDDLSLSLPQALSLWADIDTYGNDEKTPQVGSLYSDLFLSRTVRDLAAHPQPFALPIPDAVPAGARTISHPQNRLAIQAALRITAADLDAIRERVGIPNELTVANLSVLHRYAVLARALRMFVRDLLDFWTLSGIHPFSLPPATPGNAYPTQQEGTARFVALARKVQRSGFSMTLLNYLYRHREDPARRLGFGGEERAAHLTTLRDGSSRHFVNDCCAIKPRCHNGFN